MTPVATVPPARLRIRGLALACLLLMLSGTAATTFATWHLVRVSEQQALARYGNSSAHYLDSLLVQLGSPVTAVAASVAGGQGSDASFLTAAGVIPSVKDGTVSFAYGDASTPAPLAATPRAPALDLVAAQKALGSASPTYSLVAGSVGSYRRLVITAAVPGMPGKVVQAVLPPFGQLPQSKEYADLTIAIYAGTRADPSQRIADYGTSHNSSVSWETFDVGGQTFTAVFRPNTSLVGGLTCALPWLVLGGGFLISLVVTAWVESLRRGRNGALKLVEARTAELDRMAHVDELTGLPNRRLLLQRLEELLVDGGDRAAVLFLDVDHFKSINDAHGHAGGDQVLRTVAERLSETCGPGDTVARLGGDEFVVVCCEVAGTGGARDLARMVADHVAQPLDLGAGTVSPSVSVGITLLAGHPTVSACLHAADQALYLAKDRGRGRAALSVLPGQRKPEPGYGLREDAQFGA